MTIERSDGATTTSGERTDATMAMEWSDGATTTSGDLPRGADVTMTIEESDDDLAKDVNRRRLSMTDDATPPITVNTQRHRATNKYIGASK